MTGRWLKSWRDFIDDATWVIRRAWTNTRNK